MFQKNEEKKAKGQNWSKETVVVMCVILAFVLYSKYVPVGSNTSEWVTMFIYGVVIVIAILVIITLFFGKRGKLKEFFKTISTADTANEESDLIHSEIKNLDTLSSLSMIFSTTFERMKSMSEAEFKEVFQDTELGGSYYWRKFCDSNKDVGYFFMFIDKNSRIVLLDYILNGER